MPKWLIWVLVLLAVTVLTAGAAGFWYTQYHIPYQNAQNSMPQDGILVLRQQPDSTVEISWPEGINHDRYLFQVLDPTAPEKPLYEAEVFGEPKITLPEFPVDKTLTLRIQTFRSYSYPFREVALLRQGDHAFEVTDCFSPPAVKNLQWTADPENSEVHITFDAQDSTFYRLYQVLTDGTLSELSSFEQGSATVSFGDGLPLQIPQRNTQLSFFMDATRQKPDYIYYGIPATGFSLVREDLLTRDPKLTVSHLGNNVYGFSWAETKGEYDLLQQQDLHTGTWNTLIEIPKDADRTYTTGHLPRYSEFRFRVISSGGQTMEGSDLAAISQEIQITTGATPVFSTIWPMQDLEAFSDPDCQTPVGTAKKGQAYCVLDAVGDLFLVRLKDGYGYIDGRYCMINLPEYLGNICLYDITNSYESLYTVHDYEIPTITGKIILGYEKVNTANGYLVPLLYPTAKKLEKAAFAAISQGYKLKIYDSFRPNAATEALYETAMLLLPQPVPEETFTGKPAKNMPDLEEGQILTYHMLMTGMGKYDLNYFLAKGVSMHNYGVAMDLTLCDLSTQRELPMQSAMHDLSCYSEKGKSQENAKNLSRIMEEAGFGGLISEWWHFQDNEVRQELGLKSYLWGGVSPQCWIADDNGWRYRRSNGSYYKNCTKEIDGIVYVFDSQGYCTSEQAP